MKILSRCHRVIQLCLLVPLAGCGGGGGGGGSSAPPPEPPASYFVSGQITGLAGTGLTLQLNGADDTQISSTGSFKFSAPVQSGSAYTVTVLQQPKLIAQQCAVTNGKGTIASSAITNVLVACATARPAFGYSLNGEIIYTDSFDPNTGAITPLNGYTLGPFDTIGVTASGNTLFAVGSDNPDTYFDAYQINQGTGALTPINHYSVTGYGQLNAAVGNPTSPFIVLLGADSLWSLSLDTVAGTTTLVSTMPNTPGYVAGVFSNDGQFLFALGGPDGNGMSTIPMKNGVFGGPTSTAPIAFGDVTGLAVDPANRFLFVTVENLNLAAGPALGSLYVLAINPATGALTQVPGSPFTTLTNPAGVAIDQTASTLAVSGLSAVTNGVSSVQTYQINPTTGNLTTTRAPVVLGAADAGSILFDPQNKFLFNIAHNGYVQTLDYSSNTGLLTLSSTSMAPLNEAGLELFSLYPQ